MNRMLAGAIGGAVATLPMTGVIMAGERLGLFQTPPPLQVTESAVQRSGAPQPETTIISRATWMIPHVAYGAGCGAGFALIRRWLPPSPLIAGLVFGEAVWAVAYMGYLPATGLYPRPDRDVASRPLTMIAAHAVFGTALADLERRLRARS